MFFVFILKVLFVLEMFQFCPYYFGNAGKQLDKKVKFNFKNYDVINWETNNYNTHIAHYLKN